MGLVGVVVLLGILIGGAWWIERRRRRGTERELARLVGREPGLVPTARPMGYAAPALRRRVTCLPRGHRRNGIELGVQGPLQLDASDDLRDVECAAFRWWWEQRGGQEQGGRYVRRDTGVAVARLPRPVPARISILEASVLGRLELTRGGRQLESSEFNRRFRVAGDDDQLTLLLLDARLQQLLLEGYPGRRLELVDDLVVLVGGPSQRDDALRGVVGELPALRADLQRLVAAFPAQFWRALVTAPAQALVTTPGRMAGEPPAPAPSGERLRDG